MYFISASAKLRDNILRQKLRITASHININVLSACQTVQNRFKISEELYFVQKNIVWIPIADSLCQVRKNTSGS